MKRIACGLLIAAAVAACDGTTDPVVGTPAISPARGGPWASTDPTVEGSAPQLLRFVPGAPPLRTHDTTQVVVEGRHSWVEILHQNGDFFLTLDIPASAHFVYADGTPVPNGQKIGVRARVDSTYISFEFQPHGSYFTGLRPVELWVSLEYVDLEDKSQLPNIWYQAESDEPWTPLPADVRVNGRWLVVKLRHFSNYAVAW